MRQAGVVAVAGVVALETMIDRLGDDHANAKRLARGLAELGWAVQVEAVETNIVVAEVADARGLAAQLAEGGVLITVLSDTVARFVTHYGIEQAEIDEALSRIEATVKVPA
jgi:threonine aldolase